MANARHSGKRMIRFSLPLICISLASCGKPLPELASSDVQEVVPSLGVQDKCDGDFTLASGRAGAVAVGLSVDSVRILFTIIREQNVSEFTSTLMVAGVGADSIRIWTGQGRVEWLHVSVP